MRTADLTVNLLGGFAVIHDSEAVTHFESDKERALLAYLAAQPDQAHLRSRLAALLWPDLPDSSAAGNLRHALSNLRRLLGSPPDGVCLHLETSRQTAQLVPELADVDLVRFLELASQPDASEADLMAASGLYAGEFLPGFSLPENNEFEEWCLLHRERARRHFLSVSNRLCRLYEQQGDFGRAIPYAEQAVAAEPWNEAANDTLIRLLALQGERSAALSQFTAFQAILAETLGAKPSADTVLLYEQIRDDRWPPEVGQALPGFLRPEHGDAGAGICVGRDEQRRRAAEIAREVCAGHGQVTLITGQAGTGKTTLMRAIAADAQTDFPRLLVATGHCSDYTHSGEPLVPVMEILQGLTGEVEAAWQAGILTQAQAQRAWAAMPEVIDTLLSQAPVLLDALIPAEPLLARARLRAQSDSPTRVRWLERLESAVEHARSHGPAPLTESQIMNQLTGFLRALSNQMPLLLMVDDLQWADGATQTMLFHLGRRLTGSHIWLIGAFRPGSDAAELTEIMRELQRQQGRIFIDLAESDGREFVDAYLDAEPNALDATFRDTLLRQTGGNPLFVAELVAELRRKGELIRDENGRWVAVGQPDVSALPARIEAVIGSRLRALPDSCRAVLETASVEGQEFTVELVAAAGVIDTEEVRACLRQSIESGQGLVIPDALVPFGVHSLSRYRFRHDLIRRYCYEQLDPVARARFHLRLGRELESLCGDDRALLSANAARLARHYELAGRHLEAARHLLAAAEHANSLAATRDSIGLLRRGLAQLEQASSSLERDGLELALYAALGVALQTVQGNASAEAHVALDSARELYLSLKDRQPQLAERFDYVPGLLSITYMMLAQHAASLEMAEQAAAQATNPQDMGGAQTIIAVNRLWMGDLAQARWFLEVVAGFEDLPDREATAYRLGMDPLANAVVWLAWAETIQGQADTALRNSERALALAHDLEHVPTLATVQALAGSAFHIIRREYDLARRGNLELARLAALYGLAHLEAEALFYRGYLLSVSGQDNEVDSIALMRQGLADWEATGARLGAPHMRVFLAEALGLAGRHEEALVELDDAEALMTYYQERLFAAELWRVRGELLLARGEARLAESALLGAIQIAHRQGARLWELRAALALAEMWAAAGQESEAVALVQDTLAQFTEGLDTPDLVAARSFLNARRPLESSTQGNRP